MNIVFLDAGTVGTDVDVHKFSSLGNLCVYMSTSKEQIPERIKDADVIITNKCKLTKDVLSAANHLELICVTATGFDNVDLNYAREKGVAVCNVKGYSTNSVALVTVSTALSLCCNLNYFDKYCKSGAYTQSGVQNKLEPVFCEMTGKTWGIYGFGNIGKRVGKIAQALGCKILVCKREKVTEHECVSLEELFKRSDIVSVHTPLNEQTKSSINKNVIDKAKPNLVLVNAARGAVLDEEAVAQAVLSGKIAAFGTDVYSTEPFEKDSPYSRLCHLDNVILTPHMAWGAYEARVRLIDEIYENITSFYDGKIRNRVDVC